MLADRVAPYGLSFGMGMHACIGESLAVGLIYDGTQPVEEHLFGLVPMAVQAMFDRDVPTGSRRSAGDGHDDRSPVLRSLPGAARSLIVPDRSARGQDGPGGIVEQPEAVADGDLGHELVALHLDADDVLERRPTGVRTKGREQIGERQRPVAGEQAVVASLGNQLALGRRRSHRVAELQPAEAPRCEDHLELSSAGPHTHVVQHVDHDARSRWRG